MRCTHAAVAFFVVMALLLTATSMAQPPVAFPTPTATPPPAVTTPTFTAPAPAAAPAPFPPATVQPQPFPSFDPYAQPAQFVTPAPPPPAAVPYTAPPPSTAPLIPFPSITNVAGGFYGSFEATVLEPHVGGFNEVVNVPPAVGVNYDANWDLEFAPRVNIGYKGAGGLGLRGRWWWFDHSTTGQAGVTIAGAPAGTFRIPTNLEVNAIDLEGTQDGQFNSWDLQLAGGVRYATIDYVLHATVPINPDPAPPTKLALSSDFSGVGPTIALAGRRPLTSVDGLAFLANIRVAFLFGDTEIRFVQESPAPRTTLFRNDNKDLIQVWETQIGVEYSREIQYGMRVFGGAFLEAQVWEWDDGIGIGGGDLGFFGPTAAIGIAR